MRAALKLNAIEQEHLQELYDAAGVARDELPYTEQFQKLCQDFQDRTFKNADPEQVFAAIIKYVKSSTCAATPSDSVATDEQIEQLKALLKRQGRSTRTLPYSSEYDSLLKDFRSVIGSEMTEREFWMALCRVQSRSRRPPTRRPTARVAADDDEEEGE